MNYQTEFRLHTLIYIARMVAQGDYEIARRCGLRPDQIEKILSLNTQEIHEIAQTNQARYLQIRFDSEALDIAFEICGRHIKERELILQVLSAGASLPVMKRLFGLTSADNASYRKYLNLPKGDGRPSIPSEKEQVRIWELWQATEQEPIGIPERLLHIHRQTQIKINAIWPLIQDWFVDHPMGQRQTYGKDPYRLNASNA